MDEVKLFVMSNKEPQGIDFKPYLEAVNTASQRTRSTIYVLVAALLLIFTAYRNTSFPDWTDSRLTRLQEASICLEANLADAECEKSIDYAKEFLFQGSSSIETKISQQEFKAELKEQINAFIRQRTDELSLRLPFFGITIDMNDLGVVVGLLLASILYVLYASLKSEFDNIEIAKKKMDGMDKDKRQDNVDLLLMAQVLASPTESKIGVRKGIYVLFILAIIPHLFVLKSDYETLNTAAVLEGLGWARFEMVIDFIAFLLIVSFVALCILQQRRLNHSLDNLTLPDSSNPTPGNDVLDKPRDEKESPEQRVTAKSKRKYILALLFASISVASTITLLIIYRNLISGNFSRVSLSSDFFTEINITAIFAAIGTFSAIFFNLRSDKRAAREDERNAREQELRIAQLERELAASREKPALPKPEGGK